MTKSGDPQHVLRPLGVSDPWAQFRDQLAGGVAGVSSISILPANLFSSLLMFLTGLPLLFEELLQPELGSPGPGWVLLLGRDCCGSLHWSSKCNLYSSELGGCLPFLGLQDKDTMLTFLTGCQEHP